MKRALFLLLILTSLSGCEKKTSWSLKGQLPNLVVVDCILTDKVVNQTITLTFPVSELDKTPAPVTGATVQVTDEDSVFHMQETPSGSGIYKSVNPFSAREGKNYTLHIFYENQIITAKSVIAPAEFFNFLSYTKNQSSGLYNISWVASSFTTSSPAMWEVLLDWSKVPGYQQLDSTKTKARMLFYTLTTLDVSQIFAPSVESISFPSGTQITENRYSMTPDYAEFVREVLLETQWQGSLFNTAPANVPTNLSSGGAGFFAVCGVSSIYQTVP